MTTVLIPRSAHKALQTNAYLRNGLYPNAHATAPLMDDTNRILQFRCKEVAAFARPISGIGALVVWRAKYHSSTQVSQLWARLVIARYYNDGVPSEPYGSVKIYNAAVQIGYGDFTYGSSPALVTDTPAFFGVATIPIRTLAAYDTILVVPVDTDLEIMVSGLDNGRLVACDIYEVTKAADTTNGYVSPGINGGAPIYDNHRGDIVPLLREAWKNNAGHLFNWSSHTDATAPTNAVGGSLNIIDGSSSVSAASPGWTLDLTNRSTVRRAADGVPCIMHVYAKTTGTTGSILLKNSAGTTLATCTTTSPTAAWLSSGAFFLPATVAKYDVTHTVTAGVTTTYAVSVMQWET